MPKFVKGVSPNQKGRPKGSPNKTTGTLREVISKVLCSEMTPRKLRILLMSLGPARRLEFMIKLTDFVLPKLRQTDLNLDFEKMSDQQLDVIINRLLTNSNESNTDH